LTGFETTYKELKQPIDGVYREINYEVLRLPIRN